jgi:hypothetical protein
LTRNLADISQMTATPGNRHRLRVLASYFVFGSGRNRSISDCATMISFITLTRWMTRLVLPGVALRSAVTVSSCWRNLTRALSSVAIRSVMFRATVR